LFSIYIILQLQSVRLFDTFSLLPFQLDSFWSLSFKSSISLLKRLGLALVGPYNTLKIKENKAKKICTHRNRFTNQIQWL